MRLHIVASLIIVVILLVATLVTAQASSASVPAAGQVQALSVEQARRNQSLMGSIMSPFCPGKTIESCPSPRAEAWRRDISAWVREGASGEEIRTRLQARVPGFDLSGRPGVSWDWALPVGALALASVWLLVMVMRFRKNPGAQPTYDSAASRDALDDRLDRELRL